MAFIKKPEPTKEIHLSEFVVQNILAQYKDHQQRYEVMIPRCKTQVDNEADVLAIRRSGFCDEFEVKLTRSDLVNDKNKKVKIRDVNLNNPIDKHWIEKHGSNSKEVAPWQKSKYDALVAGGTLVNYFWYVIKEGIASKSDIPSWAGLIIINKKGHLTVVRHPERLKSEKLTEPQKYQLSKSLNARFWEYRSKLNAVK
jgi:hypothetical protein